MFFTPSAVCEDSGGLKKREEKMDWISIITAVVASFGGLELVKWLYSRKYGKKLEEVKANSAEFALLKERLDYLNQQMLDKEKRFTEQTDHVRALNRELIDKEVVIGDLKANISALHAERKLKLCERRGCQQRQPQSGY